MNERWFCQINGKLHINLPRKKPEREVNERKFTPSFMNGLCAVSCMLIRSFEAMSFSSKHIILILLKLPNIKTIVSLLLSINSRMKEKQ